MRANKLMRFLFSPVTHMQIIIEVFYIDKSEYE